MAAYAELFDDDKDANFVSGSKLVLNYLNTYLPMGMWSVSRVENNRQTILCLNENNDYGLVEGDGHPWQDSMCVHMVSGKAPRVAPDVAQVKPYAEAAAGLSMDVGAYAGAPIVDADGSLFGVICGLDPRVRPDLATHGPLLSLLSKLLGALLAGDRMRASLEQSVTSALTPANTDPMTGVLNRRGWDELLDRLDREYVGYGDPTVVIMVELDIPQQVGGDDGSRAGDEQSRLAARVIRANQRSGDVVARLGGNKLGIVLLDCPAALASTLADRLSHELEEAGAPGTLGWAPMSFDGLSRQAVERAERAIAITRQTRLHDGGPHAPTGAPRFTAAS